jgi:hypothetical protein
VAGGLVGLTPVTSAVPAVRNVRTGVWSDPSTWSGGKLPLAGEPAARVAGTTVTVTGAVQAAGVTVEAGGRLAFDPNASAELTSSRNIVVSGTLSMRPAASSVVRAIRFAGVDAARIDLSHRRRPRTGRLPRPVPVRLARLHPPPGTHPLRAILIRTNGSSLRSAPVTMETTGAHPPEGTA